MLPRRRRTGRKAGGVSCFRFQNECNKVEIALRVVQFWSEIKLVITNRTPASRSCDFVITRLISDQIALHSVQLPLINQNRIRQDLLTLIKGVNTVIGIFTALRHMIKRA